MRDCCGLMRAAADVAAVNMEAANMAAEIVAAGWVWLWWWGQQPTGVAVGGVVVGACFRMLWPQVATVAMGVMFVQVGVLVAAAGWRQCSDGWALAFARQPNATCAHIGGIL